MSGYVFLMILAIITGLASGAMARLFKVMIRRVSDLFIPRIVNGEINWWIIGIPVAGILLTGIFTRYIIHTNLTHICAQLIHSIKEKTYRLRHNEVFSAVIGGTITLGMGGSSGAEGPIAATGGAIGSNIGQLLGLDNNRLKILIACGASAGIAGIFSAPIGGLMFSLELVGISLTTVPVLTVTVSAFTAYLTVYALEGQHHDLIVNLPSTFDWHMLPAVICLGIFCGIYSMYYSGVTNYMDTVFKRLTNPWVRNLTGGVMLGMILLLFPSMFSTSYGVLGDVINGDFSSMAKGSILSHLGGGDNLLALCATGILILKCWAVSATNSSGGVGGDFAPTLVAGGILGYLFAFLYNRYTGSALPAGLFAFYGMAGAMSGIIRTPIMSIFIVVEMTGCYGHFLPVSIIALMSFLTVRFGAISENAAKPIVRHLNWF